MSDGGPAFPYSALLPNDEARQLVGTMYADNIGMTLRDYFAGQALVGAFGDGGNTEIQDDVMARRCYELADAMLEQRAK